MNLARATLENSGDAGLAVSLSLTALHFLWLRWGGSIAMPIACSLVSSGPAFAAVRDLTGRRRFAPLVRGSLERVCTLAAAGIAACGVCAQLGWIASHFCRSEDAFAGLVWSGFVLAGPPCIGAAAWACGELLSGASKRREASLAAAIVAAYAAGVLGFGMSMSPGAALALAAAASATAAPLAYFAVRGEPIPAR